MTRVAMIAAMEREVQPLVRGWQRSTITAGARSLVVFAAEHRVVAISGIGHKNAEQAARAAVERFNPAMLISIGVAGALIRSLKVGSVFTPSVVVDAADGAEYRCGGEAGGVIGGVLVSADKIAGAGDKQRLVERFHALVVDMEAAGVASVAQESQIGFRCVKAISDEADFVMPPLGRFVDAEGNFQSGKFLAWTALRPWQWARVAALGRNSVRATRALCEWLKKNHGGSAPPAEIVTLKRAEFSEIRTK
jgi:adenosylhomocysteine nucleosidase